MKVLRPADLFDVLRIGRTALECAQPDEMRSEVLRLFEQVFQTDDSNFFLARGQDQRLDLNQVISRGIGDKYLTQFRQYYYKLDPFLKHFNTSSTIVTTEQIVSFKDLMQSEYYNDFLKPQSLHYQITLYLKSGKRLLGLIALFRPRNVANFSYRDKAKAELMAPYLAGSLEKTIVLDQILKSKGTINSLTSNLPYKGIIVLDESLQPIYMNENAINIMSTLYKGEGSQESSLLCLPKELYLRCQEFKKSASLKGNSEIFHQQQLNLAINGAGQRISIHLRLIKDIKQSPIYLIGLEPDEPIESMCRCLKKFGVSRREADVVYLVCQGLKNSEIGEKLFISEYTVENHLRAIYEKLGVKNRTSMVHQVMNLNGQMSYISI